MLSFNNLTFQFDENLIFKNLNLTLEAGSLLIITGKNGSGKTSLLKLCAGLLEPSKGNITCMGQNILENFNQYIYDYSYIGVENIFNDHFTVEYYLKFWNLLCENNKQDNLNATIKYFNLNKILDYKVSMISSGWKKRLSFAKLMIENRLLWFLDEPFTYLDNLATELLINLINSRLLNNGIVILSSNQNLIAFKDATIIKMEDYKKQ